jgi:hypothetical protein
VWSALGGELKPSLDLVVVAPFDLGREIDVGPPVLEGPQLVVAGAKPAKRGRGKGAKEAADQPVPAEEAPASGTGARPRRLTAAARVRRAGDAAGDDEPAVAAEMRAGGRRGNSGRRIFITELPT